MEKISTTQINNLIIEGVVGDYVFETIKKENQFYEKTILDKWLPYISNAKTIFDIGANLGNHTLFWAQNTQYAAIYSFEPYSINYERLANNILNNKFTNVFPVNYGVGACKGYSSVIKFTEKNYGSTTLDPNIGDDGDIKIIDIDSFVSEQGIEHVDFIKIDTEAFEESVLAGMKQVLALHHPDLWIEVSQDSFQCIINVLLPLGYIIADVEGFNMLFLSEQCHKDIHHMSLIDIFKQHFNNLYRTNKYYQNYITAKEWVDSKNQSIEKLKESIATKEKIISEKYTMIQEQESNVRSLMQDNYALNQQLQEIQKENSEFSQELIDIVLSQDSQIQVLLQAKRVIQTQQRELQLLRQENERNKQRWDRLSSKWYGKLALKIYYKLRVMNILK